MPFGPQTPGSAGPNAFGAGGYRCTRIRLTRQVIVDAKNPNLRTQAATAVQREPGRERPSSLSGPISSSPEMWDMTTIGEGSFKLFVSWFLLTPLHSKERSFSRVHASQFIGFVISFCWPGLLLCLLSFLWISFNGMCGSCGVYEHRLLG